MRRLEQARLQKTVATIPELISAWEDGYNVARAADPAYPREVWIDFVHPNKAPMELWTFVPADIPGPGIRGCHAWSFEIVDR